MFVKVCGLTGEEQIEWAAELGYSAIGVVLHPGSPRYCRPEKAERLARHAGNSIIRVAVGLTLEEVEPVIGFFDYVQIYQYRQVKNLIMAGDEYVPGDYSYFLYDRSRGSGEEYDFPEWLSSLSEWLIISGGLNESNVGRILKHIKCFGLDVSSGVEGRKGVKDFEYMRRFISEVRNAER
ncbi:MAG: phosphoribosylanthranilate isomerase [Spirochaetes bacterium]|nr:phosphoribosylanthranilate isomerase [Spirochaetota bacterium]